MTAPLTEQDAAKVEVSSCPGFPNSCDGCTDFTCNMRMNDDPQPVAVVRRFNP